MATDTASVIAAAFEAVRYDPISDQLIVTMVYDGTNPDHHFSIEWGPCHRLDEPGQPTHQTIDVTILDDQWNDAPTKTYKKTVKVPLATLSCRPVTVTMRSAPEFIASLDIPARP